MATAQELRNAPPERDVLGRVPKAQRHLWEYHDGRSINETLLQFLDIAVDVTVAIKLIGFDGDGYVFWRCEHLQCNRARLKWSVGQQRAVHTVQ
jgi:hypothetical protein